MFRNGLDAAYGITYVSISEPVLFAGPTRWGLGRALGDYLGLLWCAPAARGAIQELVETRPPGVVVLVDGVFHHAPAVGHAELLAALRAGWEVWGLGSMGAIRAAEMHSLGMRGYGVVFDSYRERPDMCDDEVTLLHEPDAPYRHLSEPLFHLRSATAELVRKGFGASAAARVLNQLQDRWYGHRTWALWQALALEAGATVDMVEQVRARPEVHRRKSLDLLDFLEAAPWIR